MKYLFLAFFLGSATLCHAQSTAGGGTGSTVDQTFPIAPQGAEAVQQGQIYVANQYSDWSQRCVKGSSAEVEDCAMYQLLKDGDGNSVSEITILKLPSGGAAAAGVTVITPLGTLLTAGLGVDVPGGFQRSYPFTWCEAQGCVARFGLTQDELGDLKAGDFAIIQLTALAVPDVPILLEMSLSGFTAAWNSLDAQTR